MKKRIAVILTTMVMLFAFTIAVNAADTINISISGDLATIVRSYFGMIRGPLETAFYFLYAYAQYLVGWVASFF